MTRQQWLVSALIVSHVVALFVVSVPDPARFPFQERQLFSQASPSPTAFSSAVDKAARAVTSARTALYWVTAPVRRVAIPYATAGIGEQQWRMFSDPYLIYKYVRVDHYVAGEIYRHVVYPKNGDQRMRWFHQYRDKAISVAVERYYRGLLGTPTQSNDAWKRDEEAAARRYFEPIARYFHNRIAEELAGERVTRTDVWYGVTAMPSPGTAPDAQLVQSRLAALEPYLDGPAPVPFVVPSRPSRLSVEREADLEWTLLYVDQP